MTESIFALLALLGAGIGAYSAIRSDLARLHEKAEHAMISADRAHARIDDFHNNTRRVTT